MNRDIPLIARLARRQIHLDFHNSPEIDDLGCEFDPEAFADQLQAARAESVTLFAKCHHGMCYYPTRCGIQHPALGGRDLLGEQIEALHRRGIRCPLYVTVGWEEWSAHTHRDWRQLTREGESVRAEPTLGEARLPGGWYFMNWLHPAYQDLIASHLEELFEAYPVDGIFFDIVVFDRAGGWSPHALAFRQSHGLAEAGPEAFDRFQAAAQKAFTSRFTGLIQAQAPSASVFYNAAAVLTTDHRAGIRIRANRQSHYELESLPTGHWGYYHFPRTARFVAQLDLPWLGQTGRFQKSWGDFGGIKPLPALEYECFRTQALGGAVGVGDQLPPRGQFDSEALDLIADVFRQVEAAEAFYEGARPFFDVGVIVAGSVGSPIQATHRSESGAVLLCQAAGRHPALLDDASDLDAFPALVLPDEVCVTDALVDQLRAYYEKGGKLILSFRSGFDATGRWRLDFLPFKPLARSGYGPTYWRPSAALSTRWAGSDRVIYAEGMNIEAAPGTIVLIERVLPYFQRTDAHFSSHFQAPPRSEADAHPALVEGKGFLYFADPIFRDYRQSSQVYLREIWTAAMTRLLGPGLLQTIPPPSLEVIPMRKGADLLLTVLRYLPVRKALEIDVIDERLPLAGEVLEFSHPPETLLRYPDGQPLERDAAGAFHLTGKGRLLLKAPGYTAFQEF